MFLEILTLVTKNFYAHGWNGRDITDNGYGQQTHGECYINFQVYAKKNRTLSQANF